MGIFDNFSSLFRKKAASSNLADANWVSLNGGNSDAINERNLLLNNKEWVYVAVDKVAAATASVRIKVMRYQRNGDDQEVFDGPLVQFLEKPGVNFTGKDFVYLNTVYKELTGNAFWERDKGSKKLQPLVPTNVKANVVNGKLTSFKYREGANERTIKADDVLHDRYIDPARPWWGAGKLQKIARWVDTSSFANEFLRVFFINGASFGGFIETEEESEERIKLIKLGLMNDHVGVSNAHKTAVLPKGSKYTRTTGNMAEMEMGATDDRYRDKILAGFGVPKTLVGLTTEVNRASAEASEYIFARYTIKPIVEDLMEFLNDRVAAQLDPTGKFYFSYDEFVPVNMEIELKEREIALNRQPYKTVNEVRSEQGLPPVDGGDVVYAPPFQQPLGSPSAAPELPVDDEDDEDEEIPAKAWKGRPRSVSGRMRANEKRETALDSIFNAVKQTVDELEDTQEFKDATAHKSFVGRVESYLDRVANAVQLFNSEQQTRVRNNLQRITKGINKGDLFDFTEEVSLMVNFVEPILRGLMTEQALAEYEAQGFEGVFDSADDMLRKTTEYASKRLAKSYNKTTAKLLQRALNDGISAGEGLSDLTKRVQEIYEFSDQTRAKAVAHTESFYIANEGNREAYRQSGVVETMRWYTAEDERVCPHCNPMNGKVVGVNERFFKKGETMVGEDGSPLVLNYRSIYTPPLHTNCRCFIRPEDISI